MNCDGSRDGFMYLFRDLVSPGLDTKVTGFGDLAGIDGIVTNTFFSGSTGVEDGFQPDTVPILANGDVTCGPKYTVGCNAVFFF